MRSRKQPLLSPRRGSEAAETPGPSGPSLTRRVWTAVLVVLCSVGLVHGVQLYAVPSVARQLKAPLSTLPYEFNGWIGTDVEADPRVFQYLGTNQTISRSYTNADRQTVSVHCAAWLGPEHWVPHPPEACYRGAGWTIASQGGVRMAGAPGATGQFLTCEQEGHQIDVLYWYRLGDVYFRNREEARTARRKLWGTAEWPPLIKVIVQSSGDDFSDPRPGMQQVAAEIDRWSQGL